MSRFIVIPKRRKGKSGYWADITLKGGRRRRIKLAETRREAEARAKVINMQLAKGEPIDARGRKVITFRAFVEQDYIPTKKGTMRSWMTNEWMRVDRLIKYFGDTPMLAMDRSSVYRYQNDRLSGRIKAKKDKVKNATVNRELSRLKNILYLAEEMNVIPSNPMRRFPIGGKRGLLEEPRIRFLNREEFARLLEYVNVEIWNLPTDRGFPPP